MEQGTPSFGFHWLELLSTRLPLALSNVLVWGGGSRFCLLFDGDGVCLPLSPLGTSSNLSCLELSRLKAEARNKHAIAVIWAYWLGSKVLEMHIPSLPSWNLQ